MMKPGGKLTEAIGFGVFALAAGNIMVYTVQCFKQTYSRPPLSTWQKGAGEKTKGKENKTEDKKSKEPGLIPKILKIIPGAGPLGEILE